MRHWEPPPPDMKDRRPRSPCPPPPLIGASWRRSSFWACLYPSVEVSKRFWLHDHVPQETVFTAVKRSARRCVPDVSSRRDMVVSETIFTAVKASNANRVERCGLAEHGPCSAAIVPCPEPIFTEVKIPERSRRKGMSWAVPQRTIEPAPGELEAIFTAVKTPTLREDVQAQLDAWVVRQPQFRCLCMPELVGPTRPTITAPDPSVPHPLAILSAGAEARHAPETTIFTAVKILAQPPHTPCARDGVLLGQAAEGPTPPLLSSKHWPDPGFGLTAPREVFSIEAVVAVVAYPRARRFDRGADCLALLAPQRSAELETFFTEVKISKTRAAGAGLLAPRPADSPTTRTIFTAVKITGVGVPERTATRRAPGPSGYPGHFSKHKFPHSPIGSVGLARSARDENGRHESGRSALSA